MWPRVSIIIVNYNSGKHLGSCLASLRRQTYTDYEVILVDNGSTDGSVDLIEKEFPEIVVIRNANNLGFGHACNLGTGYASGEHFAFLNPDTVVAVDWLEHLVRNLTENSTIALVTPKVLLFSCPDRIDTCGNDVHITGLASSRGWGKPAIDYDESEPVCAISGAAFLIPARVFQQVGQLDSDFFLYFEDTDLSWRVQLAGHGCLYVSEACVYHDHTPSDPTPEKYFYLERNRYRTLLKNLRWRTLALLAVPLVLTEVVTWCYALVSGWAYVHSKLRAYYQLAIHLPSLLALRRKVQRLRRAPDRSILRLCTHRLPYTLAADSRAARLAQDVLDPVFRGFQRMCWALVRW
jgi:GT2 family glycosyltransferase